MWLKLNVCNGCTCVFIESFSLQTEQILNEYKIRALACHPDKHLDNPRAGEYVDHCRVVILSHCEPNFLCLLPFLMMFFVIVSFFLLIPQTVKPSFWCLDFKANYVNRQLLKTAYTEEGIHYSLFWKHNRLIFSFFLTVADFQKLQEAKEVLCNETKRKNYDLWKRSGVTISFHDWQALNDSVKTVRNVSSSKIQNTV